MRTLHVVPLHDLVEHHVPGGLDAWAGTSTRWLTLEAGPRDGVVCVCGTRPELVGNGWMVVHHSLDGREHHELAGHR